MDKNGSNGGDGVDGCIDLAGYRMARNASEMIHSEIKALHSYWEGLRAQRPCPYRAEVDPRDMKGDARNLFVLENLGEGNIRFRLAGSALEDAIGYDLRGMSVRTIMSGKARESFAALITETLAEPGVGYARLLAPDGAQIWEIVLLPLRSDFGRVDRLIGCLHPVSGRAPVANYEEGGTPLRFSIDAMWIRPVTDPADTVVGDAMPLAGFGEDAAAFVNAPQSDLIPIEGGLGEGERKAGT